MLRDTVRGFVTVASGLAEEAGKRVVLTAAELLERSGIDLAEVERKARAAGQFPPSVKSLQTLAEEAVTAGRAGFDLATGVARSEVEKAFEKVGDQVTKVGVVLAYLESRLRDVEEDDAPAARPADKNGAAAARADGLFGHGWEQGGGSSDTGGRPGEPIVAERVPVDDGGSPEPAGEDRTGEAWTPEGAEAPQPPAPTAPAKRAAAGKAARKTPGKPAAKAGTGGAAAAGRPAARTAPAKQAPAKQATAKGTPAKGTPAKGTPAKQASGKGPAAGGATPDKAAPAKKAAAAKKPAAKKAAGKKTTVTRTASAGQPTAKKATPAAGATKRAATKRTTVRRTTSSKGPDA
ncbi:hypothetical protein GCM10010495_63330 [Kitasatospora herbaricolor]|uniref:hypothetical protein n=1 Tax=Kitasatospora herbaricolor TaxID=68217 RepID=UPI00174956D7|nr:hypothetical protein [Kitasatospora herbaricolor]MDQ0311277.1 hypothetical protein [Kitasatospora herbaricolor]GGV37411.1 hypothetical protein GCM10010495_63330 [Kitasatospora herbaricolor]